MTESVSQKAVCVYCGSSFGKDPQFSEEARKLGKLLHAMEWKLVYGGGTTGLMGEIAKATMGPEADGSVHGIIPNALVSRERTEDSPADKVSVSSFNDEIKKSVENHNGLTPLSREYGVTTIVPDMHTRKRMMATESDAFVAMPGGYGTLEEIMECITWSQLGIHKKPVVLFNTDGFFDGLLQFIQHAIKSGFISEKNGKIIQVATTAEEVIEKIQKYQVPEGRFTLNWDDEKTIAN
ncbi:LANO_0F06414g1_1 [Lachancea nothofagi CBS 11611]|uniref:LANO_0F06414g1_1 n=1 Tax=Lachancea nothofagi CBS 11611 TaxID=1266666 RepID=A0A1G4K8L1_9SACH|nr:LANO_0F06414g1_1 [Lachancea nothofagi CBS 11611]